MPFSLSLYHSFQRVQRNFGPALFRVIGLGILAGNLAVENVARACSVSLILACLLSLCLERPFLTMKNKINIVGI